MKKVERAGEPNEPWTGQQGWHRAAWGPLGWLETVIKLAAVIVALVAVVGGGRLGQAQGHTLVQALLVLVAIGYLGTIGDRFKDREIVAMIFVGFMVAGHWAMVLATGRNDWPGNEIKLFAGLMLLGDLVKIVYFLRSKASIRGLPPKVPIGMTMVLVAIYAVIVIVA